jgi:hypothetical protein
MLPPQRGRGQLGGEGIDSEGKYPLPRFHYDFGVASKVASISCKNTKFPFLFLKFKPKNTLGRALTIIR